MTRTTVSLVNEDRSVVSLDGFFREPVGEVPGSGPIRGVAHMTVNGLLGTYATRENSDHTRIELYRASDSGWVLVPFADLPRDDKAAVQRIEQMGILVGWTK